MSTAVSNRSPNVRLLPHNETAEECVLGAMLLSRQAILDAAEMLTASDFCRPRYGTIFTAITTVEGRGDVADVVTVGDQLRRTGLIDMAGGESELIRLQASTPSSSSKYYAQIVADHGQLRRLITASSEVSEAAYAAPTDVAGLVDLAQQKFFEAMTDTRRVAVQPLNSVLSAGLDRLEAIYEAGGALLGVATPWHDLNEILLGLIPGSLITVGARPAMGKSAFALNIAHHAATEGVPTLFVSLEMSEPELTQRLLASEAKIDATKLRNGKLTENDWPKITQAIGRLTEQPLQFLCTSGLSMVELRSRARQMCAKGELKLLVVDYLQLMDVTSGAERRDLEIAELTRGLKKLAVELQIPIVLLSQLNRGVESRADKRPQLADLKESSAIEQDSDVVIFLYRDDAYNPDSADRGIAEIIIAKHRQGPCGTIRLVYLEHYTKFANFARTTSTLTNHTAPAPATPQRPRFIPPQHIATDPNDPNLNDI